MNYHPTRFEQKRRERVYALREQGYTFPQIAKALACISPKRTHMIYHQEQRRVMRRGKRLGND